MVVSVPPQPLRTDAANTNVAKSTRTGSKSHWSLFKRGIVGTYNHISPKHTERYAVECAGRHNDRTEDTVDEMAGMVCGMEGNRLPTRT